jgi:hypothetical protein
MNSRNYEDEMHVAALIARVFLASFVLVASALAQVLPNQLVGGQVRSALIYGSSGWCSAGQGASQFQRNGSGAVAVLSFPELTYFDGSTYYPLDGQARLTFTSATSGNIKFKFWGATAASISNPSFDSYTETFNGQQYQITFNVLFPGCTLPIYAGYEIPL